MRKIVCVLLSAVVFTTCISVLLFSGCKNNSANISYEIDCEFDGEKVTGREKVTFKNFTDNAFNELKFELYPNAFRKGAVYSPVSAQYYYQAYKWGESYGEINVSDVKVNGSDAENAVSGADMNILSVKLSETVFPDERVTVEMTFNVTLAKVIARTGVNSDTINLANFYPILCGIENGGFYECVYYSNGDPFFSDPSDYSVNFTCDKKYVVASSGKKMEEKADGDKRVYKYGVRSARSFAIVLSEKFSVINDVAGDTELLYYYYKDGDPEKSVETARKAFALFTEKFGEYPYETFSVVETPFVQGGMEFSALVFISDELEDKAYKEVIVHETAHQWWQTVVGNNEIKHPFIDEGLAEYSVVLFYENFPEYGFSRQELITSSEQSFKLFCSVYKKIIGNADTSMLRSVPEYSGEYEYVNIAYIKSCIMFDYLRNTIGDESFFKGLKRFYAENAFKTATPDSLVGAFERAGANSNGFFETFFNGKEII